MSHDKTISTVKVDFHSVKFPRGQKMQPDFSTGHVSSLHFKNRAEKNVRKKIEIFQLLGGFLRKKIDQPMTFK